MANKLIAISIFVILFGLCLSYLMKPNEVWYRYYYSWDKLKDLLLVWTVYVMCKNSVLRKCLKALWFFLLIRFLWEALAIPNYKVASWKEITDILFTIDLIVILFIIFISYKPKLTNTP